MKAERREVASSEPASEVLPLEPNDRSYCDGGCMSGHKYTRYSASPLLKA